MKRLIFLVLVSCGQMWAAYAVRPGFDVQATENLVEAAEHNDLQGVERAIAAGADVNAVDGFGYIPLHWAAKINAKDIVKLLIKAGADVTVVDYYGVTPLCLAATFGAKDAAKVLLEYGAEIPYRLNYSQIEFLDSVIKEINKERLAEEEALFALSHLRAGDTLNPKKNMNAFILQRLYKRQLPLASEVVKLRLPG